VVAIVSYEEGPRKKFESDLRRASRKSGKKKRKSGKTEKPVLEFR
jgi:hypothetical protein